MNILLLVTELNSANGICTQSVMREMVSRGHTVYCLTNHEKHGDLDKAIRYCYVKPRLVYRLLNRSNDRKIAKTIGVLLNKVKLAISYPTWPLISPLYARRIYRAAKAICQENHIDMIIPIYTQIDTLIAANRIKKEMPDIRYIPYFLDSLSGGYGPKCLSKEWVRKRGIKWEKRLLPNADTIIMMQSSRKHYEEYCSFYNYFKKIRFLDLPLFNPHDLSNNHDTNTWRYGSDKINLLFIGTIPVHIRPIEYFMELFMKLSDDRLRLIIVGSSTCGKYLENVTQKDPRIVLLPFVPHEEAMQTMREADFLVNFGNNDIHMTPSKIFEYMSMGKPIISTAPIKDEPCIPYLNQYPAKFIVDYNDDMDTQIGLLKTFIDETYQETYDINDLKTTFYLNTPKAFLECVRLI